MTVTIKAYSYIRMSSETQTKGDSLQRQLEKTKRYADEKGWILDDSLRDMGVSAFKGKNIEDGALGKFINLCRAGEIETGSVLIIENLDRMSRQRPIDAFNIFTSILKLGVDIVVLDDGKHFTEDNMDMGNLFISIGGMVRAYAESERKSQLISSAWARKRANGTEKKLTRRCPAWLVLSKDRTHFEIIEDRVATIRTIFDLCLQGHGYVGVTRRLNDEKVPTFSGGNGWHQSTIKTILRGKAVIGFYQPHTTVSGKRVPTGDMIEDYYPKVIDEAIYYGAQEAIESRVESGKGRKGKQHSNLLTGILKCGECGHALIFRNRPKGKRVKAFKYVRCYDAGRGLCSNTKSHDYEILEFLVLESLRELSITSLTKPQKTTRKNILDRIIATKGKLKTVIERRKKLLLQFADTSDDTILELITQLGDDEVSLKNELATLSQSLGRASIPKQKPDEILDNVEAYISLTKNAAEKDLFAIRTMIATELKKILDHVTIHGDGLITMYAAQTNAKYAMFNGVGPDGFDSRFTHLLKELE